jgi:hypothetical protein
MLAIALVTPLRAFAQTPAPAEAAPPAAAPPAAAPATPPPAAPAAAPMAPPAAPAAAPAAPAAPPVKLTWNGLVDTYYMYYFNPGSGVSSIVAPTTAAPGVGRAFDTNANSITLALTKLSVNAAVDPVAFQFDLGYGTTGTIINASQPILATGVVIPTVGQGQVPPSFLIEQAFGTISLPANLTLDFGKFVTTAGAEVIEANKNWMYSRSLLFNAIPLLHTGARANLKINDMVTVQGSVVNGWNNDPDLNAWKTVGLSASITASPMVSIIATTYFGKEGAPQAAGAATPGDLRFLGDLVAALTLSPQLGANINVDYIKAFDNVAADYQIGVAGMVRYVINDHVNVAGRGEYLGTHVGTTTSQEEFTVMCGLDVGKNFELRPEVRGDFSGQPIFAGANAKKNEFTGTLAALTWF